MRWSGALSRAWAAAGAVVVLATVAAAAEAAPVSVGLVNSSGQLVDGSIFYGPPGTCPGEGCPFASTADGRVTVDLQPGDHVAGTWEPQNCPAAGPAVVVPDPVPATLTVQGPDTFRLSEPGTRPDERGLVGAVNAERAKLGRAPVTISNALNRGADTTSELHVRVRPGGGLDHWLVCGPEHRAQAFGWPTGGSGLAEILVRGGNGYAPTARGALESWMKSDGHRAIIIDAAYRFVGVGNVGDVWTMQFAYASSCPAGTSRGARCELTGDAGDAGLLPAGAYTGGASGGSQEESEGTVVSPGARRSGLKVTRLTRRGRRVRVSYTLRSGASGSVSPRVKRCKKRKRRCSKSVRPKGVSRSQKGRKGTITFRLTRGHYAVRLHFGARRGWASGATAARYLTVPR